MSRMVFIYWLLVTSVIYGMQGFLLDTVNPQTQYSCNFESSSCQYSPNPAFHGLMWLRHKVGNIMMSLPPKDHTYNSTGRGHVMYIPPSSAVRPGDKVILQSSVLSGLQGNVAVGFWYTISGGSVSSIRLNVTVVDTVTGRAHTTMKTGQHVNEWYHGCLFANSVSGNISVIFQADYMYTPGYPAIAVDDVTVERGYACSKNVMTSTTPPTTTASQNGTYTCTFENGMCIYSVTSKRTGNWSLQATTPPGSPFTSIDHTLSQAGKGHFMQLTTRLSSGTKFQFHSRPLTEYAPGSYITVDFWYKFPNKGMDLNVYIQASSKLTVKPIFTRSGREILGWTHACVTTMVHGPVVLTFEGVVDHSSASNSILIDDVTIQPGNKCANIVSSPNTLPTSGHVSCTFEDASLCGYTNVAGHSDTFNWLRHSGPTASDRTGPAQDHTTGTGYYMYIEASSRYYGDKALLESPSFVANGNQSLSFWYNTYGTGIGSLNVYLENLTETGTILGEPVFKESRAMTTDNAWKRGCFDIPKITGLTRVVFEGVVGNDYHSDIAIDDVKLESVGCARATYAHWLSWEQWSSCSHTCGNAVRERRRTCSTFGCTGSNIQRVNCTYVFCEVSCSFETASVCGYVNKKDDFTWSWQKGQTVSSATGPNSDHTTGHGHYMYIESSSPRQQGETATLQSPQFDPDGVQRLTFWYSAYGNNIGSLSVTLEYKSFLGLMSHHSDLFKVTTGTSSRKWYPVCVDIPALHSDSYIVFQGAVGAGYNGDIGIDDVKLERGNCNDFGTTHTSSTAQPSTTTSTTTSTTISTTTSTMTSSSMTSSIKTSSSSAKTPSTTTDMTTNTSPQTTKIVGSWSHWYSDPCSVTCGKGTRTRVRHCSTGSDVHCGGAGVENVACNEGPCPVHGNWGVWGAYSTCSVTCGDGNMTSVRTCDSPTPLHGGNSCQGEAVRIEPCHLTVCVVDGQWSSWNDWTSCSASCASGSRSRSRTCDQPPASNGGLDCTGSNNETKKCNDVKCPEWSEWYHGNCHVTCGAGNTTRIRYCSTGNDVDCGNETTMETVACDGGPCPLNGVWGAWSVWGKCSQSCGNGTRDRNRKCDNPSPQYGGNQCTGIAHDTDPCNVAECPYWLPYHQVSACSVTCGRGFGSWMRNCSTGIQADCVGSKFDERVCVLDPCV